MCKPGMMEWAWQRRNLEKTSKQKALRLFPDDISAQQNFINQKLAEFDGARQEHDQMILTAIGGPGHGTL